MKNYRIIATALMCVMFSSVAFARTTEPVRDSLATALKVTELTNRRDSLRQQIQTADAGRNREIYGLSPLRMAEINERQDSICLELRSRLVAVEIELKELVPDKLESLLRQQLGQNR